jgi:hypothetical protein
MPEPLPPPPPLPPKHPALPPPAPVGRPPAPMAVPVRVGSVTSHPRQRQRASVWTRLYLVLSLLGFPCTLFLLGAWKFNETWPQRDLLVYARLGEDRSPTVEKFYDGQKTTVKQYTKVTPARVVLRSGETITEAEFQSKAFSGAVRSSAAFAFLWGAVAWVASMLVVFGISCVVRH